MFDKTFLHFSFDNGDFDLVYNLETFLAARRGWWVRNSDTDVQELAGFVKKGGNLRLVLMRNAGHSVPINQPQWALRDIRK